MYFGSLSLSLSLCPSPLMVLVTLISVILPFKIAVYNSNKLFCLFLVLGTFECTELCFRVQIKKKRSSDNTEILLCDRTDFWSD
jgi:hypothetical protein